MPARHWQTWLVLIALAVRGMIAPGFMVVPANAGFASVAIVLCTPQGLKLVSPVADGWVQETSRDTPTEPHDGTNNCPFAYVTTTLAAEPAQFESAITKFQIHHALPPSAALGSNVTHFRFARGPPRWFI